MTFEGYRTRDGSSAFTTLPTTSTIADLEFASAAVPFSVAGKPVTLQAGWRRLYQLASRSRATCDGFPSSTGSRPGGVIRIDNASDGNDRPVVAGGSRPPHQPSVAGVERRPLPGRMGGPERTSEDPGVLGPTDFSSVRISNRVSGNALNLGLLLAYPSFRIGVVYHGDSGQRLRGTPVGAVEPGRADRGERWP